MPNDEPDRGKLAPLHPLLAEDRSGGLQRGLFESQADRGERLAR